VDVVEPFGNSDHSMINFQLVFNAHESIKTEKPPVYDYAEADSDAISCALVSFNFSAPSGSADEIWVDFINPVYKIIHKKAALWRSYRRNRL